MTIEFFVSVKLMGVFSWGGGLTHDSVTSARGIDT